MLALVSSLGGQGLGSGSALGSFEVGLLTQDIARQLVDELGASGEARWGRGVLFVSVAPRSHVRVSAGGAVWYEGASDRFPTRRYRRSTLGITMKIGAWRAGRSEIGATLGAHSLFDFDESGEAYHKRSTRIFGAAVISHGFPLAGQDASAWIAPAYLRDVVHDYPYGGRAKRAVSQGNVGLVVGGEILIASHLRPYLEGTFARHLGTEFGLGYRF